MRRSINPKVLITSWPPPNENYDSFNRIRFKTWFRYMLFQHDLKKSLFTDTKQPKYITHKTLHAVYYGERHITHDTIRKICWIIARYTDRSYESLKREAFANSKPY